jgi:putative Mn2+ efflux pump MntP
MNIFERIIKFLDSTEVSVITLIAKIIPSLVPVIPAYVGYVHVTNKETGLGFDPWAGWIYGAVIEGLGYAAIYKAIQFWENNRKYTSDKNQAPLWVAILIYIVYLLVTLTVNVMLDYKAGVEIYKVVALGLISLLSVPAGLLMSISAIHTERTNEREKTNEQKSPNERRLELNERQNRTNERTPNERTNEHRTNERTPNERTNEHLYHYQRTNESLVFPKERTMTSRQNSYCTFRNWRRKEKKYQVHPNYQDNCK